MALPGLMQRSVDLPVRSHGSALSSPSRQRRASGENRHVPEITLYLEQKRTRPGASPYLESVQVPISSTVKDVRLKLQNLKGWHADKAKCSLVRNSVLHVLVIQTAFIFYRNIESMHDCCCLHHRFWETGILWSMRWLGSWPRGIQQTQTTCMSL